MTFWSYIKDVDQGFFNSKYSINTTKLKETYVDKIVKGQKMKKKIGKRTILYTNYV